MVVQIINRLINNHILKKMKLSRKLSDLVIYTQSRHLNSWTDARQTSDFHHISSIAENKCFNFCRDHGADFVRHTAFQLVRIYPAPRRVDSSNYNPITPWANGCQIGTKRINIYQMILIYNIVALNYQTTCEEMLVNQSRFKINGNSGYILKPNYLRQLNGADPNFDPTRIETFPRAKPIEYEFTVSFLTTLLRQIDILYIRLYLANKFQSQKKVRKEKWLIRTLR